MHGTAAPKPLSIRRPGLITPEGGLSRSVLLLVAGQAHRSTTITACRLYLGWLQMSVPTGSQRHWLDPEAEIR
eukprot:Skav210828  [mRNA]  locus=scaffold1597:406691:411026:- [translate_table: standard]